MKKRILALLAALIFTFLAVGCENVEYIEPSSSSEEESVDIYDKLESELPDLNSGEGNPSEQITFTIITNSKGAFYAEETNSAAINKVFADRDDFLRSKYNAKVEVIEVDENKVASELKAAITSGISYGDLLALSGKTTVSLYTAGLLTDMNTLPDFTVETPLFDEKYAKSLATNSTLYLLADPTAMFYEDAYVYFYNRDLVTSADPESLVLQGKWTWDAFNEIARASAPKVYDKVTADLNNDIFAFGAYHLEGTYPLVMWSGCGNKLMDNTYKNSVGLSMEVDNITAIASDLMNSYNSRGKFPSSGNPASNAFQNGRLAFFCNKLDYFYTLRDGTDKGSNFGILPIPKYNEQQNGYNCLVGSDARVFSVPKTVNDDSEADKRFVSAVISAICASGNSTIPKAFVNHHVGFYLNTNNETLMLQTIVDSATVDFATVYGSGITEIRLATTAAIVDYLDIGSGLANSIRYAREAFESYCSRNFN